MYYFIRVPKLPLDVSHQMGSVEINEYSIKEGSRVEKGRTIAVVENWWARMALKAVGPGYVSKTFFEPHARVLEGDPIAIVVCDPDDAPRSEATCELQVIASIRHKPTPQGSN
jgi:pyruvate/2-oxoglutarate dehydrogenase complex dihydrolipoamide acyltransferase (E2) component